MTAGIATGAFKDWTVKILTPTATARNVFRFVEFVIVIRLAYVAECFGGVEACMVGVGGPVEAEGDLFGGSFFRVNRQACACGDDQAICFRHKFISCVSTPFPVP